MTIWSVLKLLQKKVRDLAPSVLRDREVTEKRNGTAKEDNNIAVSLLKSRINQDTLFH